MFTLLLLNGGVGSRVGAGVPKQLVRIDGVPILVYSLLAASRVPEIDQIVVNYPAGWRADMEAIVADYPIDTPIVFVEAGASRQASVERMLEAVTNDRVLIHESARPLVDTSDFRRLIDSPHANVSLMAPISFTVAPVEPGSGRVVGSLARDRLRNVQLPQKFELAVLAAGHAYAAERGLRFTEDATLCAEAGAEVHFIDGSERNVKVTTPVDIRLANLLLSRDAEESDV